MRGSNFPGSDHSLSWSRVVGLESSASSLPIGSVHHCFFKSYLIFGLFIYFWLIYLYPLWLSW